MLTRILLAATLAVCMQAESQGVTNLGEVFCGISHAPVLIKLLFLILQFARPGPAFRALVQVLENHV